MHHPPPLTRRTFCALAGAACIAPFESHSTKRAAARRKAVKLGMVAGTAPLAEKFALLKQLGFDGVELDAPSDLARDEVLAAKRSSGLEIPGVVDSVHWRDTLGDADPKVRERGLQALLRALEDCKAYGGTSVLLVPAVVSKKVSYRNAWTRSQAELRKALPRAKELGVAIAIENVWNHFLQSPLELARYVDELESDHVGVHFDPGNWVVYGWPEHAIEVLGKRILKVDVKEFSRKKCDAEGRWKGFDTPIGEGDTDWPAVVAALQAVGYQGWFTAEVKTGDATHLADVARRMDAFLRR
jgi:hexulose-6-phosphate isomerase